MIHTDKMLINFMWVIHDVVELKSEKTIETENQKTIKARNIRKSRKRKNVVSHLKKTNENSTNDVHYNKKKTKRKKTKKDNEMHRNHAPYMACHGGYIICRPAYIANVYS